MLTIEDSDSELTGYSDALYIRAFPLEERFPLELMHELDGTQGARFRTFSDDGRFVGMAFTIETDQVLFVNFLAVTEGFRGKGHGSGILKLLGEESGKTVFLNMEPVTDDCDNREQRIRRREFYTRNGFRENGLTVTPDGNTFMGMVSGGDLSI